MSKYSIEQKLEVVKAVQEKGLSMSEGGSMIGASHSDVWKWVKMYEAHGVEGLLMKKGSYTGDFKLHVIKYMEVNQISATEAAVIFGIPCHKIVGRWVRKYDAEGRESLFIENRGRSKMPKNTKSKPPKSDKKTDEDLIAENQRLKMENAYLKKLNALVQERIRRESGKK
jgi:transposase